MIKSKSKKYQDLKEDLYTGYFVCFIFLCGALLQNKIEWNWLRWIFEFGFLFLLLEVVSLQYKFLKLKRKNLANKK